MSCKNTLYKRGPEFIREMHEFFDGLDNPEGLPDDVREYCEKRDRFVQNIYGQLAKNSDHKASLFSLLTCISDMEMKEFDPVGVEAMAILLARAYQEKIELQAKLEHLRWLFGHVQEAMK